MRDPRLSLCQAIQFFRIKMNTVRVPDILAHPFTRLHIVKRAHPEKIEAKLLLILGLTKMRVEPCTQLPCQNRRLF